MLSFVITYHLDKLRFMYGFLRGLYFKPFMSSAVAMAWVWRWFYLDVPIGVFNNILAGFAFAQISLLQSTTKVLPAVLAPAIRTELGFQAIIFMAELRAIPTSYDKTARIDGVGWFTILTQITIPLLRSTIVFIVVFSSIGFLRIFNHVFNMTTNNPGGPLNAAKPLVLMIYDTASNSFDIGCAAAQTVVLRLAGQLLGHHAPGPAGRFWNLPDETIPRIRSRRRHQSRPRRTGHLRVPRQLDCLSVAPDRHQLGGHVLDACRTLAAKPTSPGNAS